jgi:hypothetical protein
MPSLPELTIIDILNQIVDRIKHARPATTSGKPTEGSIVYSQLLLGMPIDMEDYARPWSAIGAASQAATAPAGAQAAGVPAVTGQPSPVLLKALEAAFHTSQLCNLMLQVTDDGTCQEYPIGRHLAFQYEEIVNSMDPLPVPPLTAAEQATLDQAMKVLYIMDETDPANPVVADKTDLFKKYEKNSKAYAAAKSAYAVAQAQSLADPAKANVWPQIAAPYQQAVDDAWDTWKTEGAEKVEKALAAYESQPINMQQAQIAKAKKQLDVWSLALAGVPVDIPYSYVDPSEWCDADNDDIGFEQLQIKRTSEAHVASTVTANNSSMWWNNSSHSLSQNGHAGFFGIGASEASSHADQHSANADSSAFKFTSMKADHFTDFEVDLEWGLVTMYRPWLNSDLFYMNNWFIQQQRAGCISDGQIHTQLGTVKQLPMIPQQILVVRNVSIKSSTWGDTANTLNTAYGGDAGQTDGSQDSAGGGGSFALGPISFGGGAQSSSAKASGSGSHYANASQFARSSASFDGTTLSIHGAQLIAFVSNIVPLSPTIDDPALPKPKSQSGANAFAGQGGPTSPAPTP